MLNTIMLLGTLTGLLLFVGFVLGGFFGLLAGVVIALGINFFSYWYSDRIVLGLYQAKPSENKELDETVKKLALEAKIPKPKLYEIPSKQPNAFATGRNPKHSAIAVTQGLLDLTHDEIEAVLAHEMGHIKNRDVLVSTMAATIAGAISYIAQMAYFSMFFAGERRGEGNLLGLIFIIVFAPLAALLVRLAISRRREYKADYIGAVITKKPGSLASALRKISRTALDHPIRGSSATSHLWIINPFHKNWFTGMFSTHPPIEARIERLEAMEKGEI